VKRESERRTGVRKREGKKSSIKKKKKKVRLKTKQNPRKQSISLKVCNACGTLEPPGELKKKILVPGSLPRDSELIGLE